MVGVSIRKSKYFRSTPKKLSIGEIDKIIESFAFAAERAKLSGFDGIQIHAAHGYLVHQFIHPSINCRDDEFGVNEKTGIGDLFLQKAISSIRKKCGSQFPILVKISASDSLPNPFSADNFVALINLLDEEKVDAIEISFGTMENALNIFRGESVPVNAILKHNFRYKINNRSIRKLWQIFALPLLKSRVMKFTEMYNLEYAKIAKKITNIPIICVGGFREGKKILRALDDRSTDFVSLCRPFICEPDFILKLSDNPNYISRCENCNICAVMCDSDNSTKCYKN